MKHKKYLGGVATIIALALVTTGLALPAHAAENTQLPDVVKSVTFDTATATEFQSFRTTFTMEIPNGATAGDTFTQTLPAELSTRGVSDFVLTAPDGATLGTATYTGVKTITFTLNSYVETHVNTTATAFITTGWDRANIATPDTATAYTALPFTANDFTVDTAPLAYTPAPDGLWVPAIELESAKNGGFNNIVTEGADNPVGALSWTLGAPLSPNGYKNGIVIIDTPAAGSTTNCTPNPLTGDIVTAVLMVSEAVSVTFPSDRYTVTCTPEQLTVSVPYLNPTDIVLFNYTGDITDASLTEYKNSALFLDPDGEDFTRTAIIRRSGNGGNGAGNQFVTVGDSVYMDANNDGVQGEGEQALDGVELSIATSDGTPALDLNGNPVGNVTSSDFDGYVFTNLKALPAGTHYVVSVNPAQAALEGYAHTTPLNLASTDLTVNGQSDLNVDFGFVPEVIVVEPPTVIPPVVEPPVVEPPVVTPPVVEPPVVTPPVVEAPKELARTGFDNGAFIFFGIGSILLGAVAMLFRRKTV